MLAFITTLRHPQNAANYDHVEALLQGTLASLTQQTCDDYLVIVVGVRKPAFALPERVTFVQVDFPPPSDIKGPRTGPASVIWDKGTKNAVGLLAARELGPDYVMFVDADDFVHRELAAFVRDRPGRAGWVVTRGLMYSRRRNAYKRLRNFYRFCGTSFVIPFDAYDVPAHLTISATQREIAAAFGERLEHVLEHGWAFDWWRNHGRELEPLPFPGAVYHVENSENHSGNRLSGPARPYRTDLLRDFAIQPSRSPASTLWASYGPAALRPEFKLPRPQPKSYLKDFTPPGDSVVHTP